MTLPAPNHQAMVDDEDGNNCGDTYYEDDIVMTPSEKHYQSSRRKSSVKRKNHSLEEEEEDAVKKRKTYESDGSYDSDQTHEEYTHSPEHISDSTGVVYIRSFPSEKPAKQRKSKTAPTSRKTTLSDLKHHLPINNGSTSSPPMKSAVTPTKTIITHRRQHLAAAPKYILDIVQEDTQRHDNGSRWIILSVLIAITAVVAYFLFITYPHNWPWTKLENQTNQTKIFEDIIESRLNASNANILDMVSKTTETLINHFENLIESRITTTETNAKESSRKDLEIVKTQLEQVISQEISNLIQSKLQPYQDGNDQTISEMRSKLDDIIPKVRKMIDESLLTFASDKIGMTDFALSSLGSNILEHSQTYHHSSNFYWSSNAKKPNTIIEPDTTIGNCWPMKGSSGYVVIQIAHPITPTAFSIDHIPKSLSPNISSAPKQVTVFGYADSTTLIKLISFEFDLNGTPIQTFHIQGSTEQKFEKFRFQFGSNYGNSLYTCIYRVRIHGNL